MYGLHRVITFNGCWLKLNHHKIAKWTLLKTVSNVGFDVFYKAKSSLALCAGWGKAQEEVNNCQDVSLMWFPPTIYLWSCKILHFFWFTIQVILQQCPLQLHRVYSNSCSQQRSLIVFHNIGDFLDGHKAWSTMVVALITPVSVLENLFFKLSSRLVRRFDLELVNCTMLPVASWPRAPDLTFTRYGPSLVLYLFSTERTLVKVQWISAAVPSFLWNTWDITLRADTTSCNSAANCIISLLVRNLRKHCTLHLAVANTFKLFTSCCKCSNSASAPEKIC